MLGLLLAALSILLLLGLAGACAIVADAKGHDALLWFLLGLVLPVIALLIVVFAVRPAVDADRTSARLPAPEAAARHSPVAAVLASEPHLATPAIAEVAEMPERQVREHLEALQALGFVVRDGSGRWALTDAGHDALGSGEPTTA